MRRKILVAAIATSALFALAQPALAQNPDGSRDVLYVPNKESNTVSVIDTDTHTVIDVIDLFAQTGSTKGPVAVVATPDGRKAYVVSTNEGGVVVINAQSGTFRQFISLGGDNGSPLAAAISRDGSTVFVSDFFNARVVAIDTASDAVVGEVDLACGLNATVAADPVAKAECQFATGFGFDSLPIGMVPTLDGSSLWVTSQIPGRVDEVSIADPANMTVTRTLLLPGAAASDAHPTAVDVDIYDDPVLGEIAYVVAFGQQFLSTVPDAVYVVRVSDMAILAQSIGDRDLGPGAAEIVVADTGVAWASNFGELGSDGYPTRPFTSHLTSVDSAANLAQLDTDGSSPTGLALSQDGSLIYACNIFSGRGENGSVSVIDAATGAVLTVIVDDSSTAVAEIGAYPATPFAFTTPALPAPPSFDAGSPCGQTFTVAPGEQVTFGTAASVDLSDPGYFPDPDGNAVFLDVSGAPSGAVTPALPQAHPSEVSVDFSWTPSAADVGTHEVTFTVTDSLGQEVECVVTIVVVSTSDVVPFGTCEITKLHFDERASMGQFDFAGRFAPGDISDGIDPLAEDVTVSFDDVAVTIPAGSFVSHGRGIYRFQGVIDGVRLLGDLMAPADQGAAGGAGTVSFRHRLWTFKFVGKYADLTDVTNPVDAGLQVGNDACFTPYEARIHQ